MMILRKTTHGNILIKMADFAFFFLIQEKNREIIFISILEKNGVREFSMGVWM